MQGVPFGEVARPATWRRTPCPMRRRISVIKVRRSGSEAHPPMYGFGYLSWETGPHGDPQPPQSWNADGTRNRSHSGRARRTLGSSSRRLG